MKVTDGRMDTGLGLYGTYAIASRRKKKQSIRNGQKERNSIQQSN